VLYAINNNLIFKVLQLLPPAVFQVLLNVRVVWTALLLNLLMGRSLNQQECVGVGALTVGACISQTDWDMLYSSPPPPPPSIAAADGVDGVENLAITSGAAFSSTGILLALIYTFISATASVYNEKLLKSDAGSMHAANLQLYMFGVLTNGAAAVLQPGVLSNAVITKGWSKPMTWVVAFNMANIGLIIAAIMKYHDNIIKIFCGAVSNVLVLLYSVWVVGDQQLTSSFILGAICCLYGAYLYNTAPKTAPPPLAPAPALKVQAVVEGER
jgi:UDP-sugar transporter A1/2/3